jgi:DNA-binding response OmpR family regulator
LLVEDEQLIQMIAIEYWEDAGFTVDAAGSASEAMNKLALAHDGVDAVIVDIGLPDRGGDVLIREIRAIHPSLPIVLATGRGTLDLKDALGGKKVALVTKPYTAQDLLGALRRAGIEVRDD